MATCWSCTVMIAHGARLCPFCGADQLKPVAFINPNVPEKQTVKTVLHDSAAPILVIFVCLCVLGGIFWHSFGAPQTDPAAQASAMAAKSLRELREALTVYALSAKDAYPASLNSLGERTRLPLQSAAGYKFEYRVKPPSSSDGLSRGFEILARTDNPEYPSLLIDETGVVRAAQQGRVATAKDPPL